MPLVCATPILLLGLVSYLDLALGGDGVGVRFRQEVLHKVVVQESGTLGVLCEGTGGGGWGCDGRQNGSGVVVGGIKAVGCGNGGAIFVVGWWGHAGFEPGVPLLLPP